MALPSFQFSHYDLGELRAGTVIEVALSAVANVRLMTPWHYQAFTEILPHKFIGGVAKKSLHRLTIPESEPWHLVIDMESHHGLAESIVKKLEAPLPRLRTAQG